MEFFESSNVAYQTSHNDNNLFNVLDILTKLDITYNLTQFRAISKSLEDLFSIFTEDVTLTLISVMLSRWASALILDRMFSKLTNSSLQSISTPMDRYDNVIEMEIDEENGDASTK